LICFYPKRYNSWLRKATTSGAAAA